MIDRLLLLYPPGYRAAYGPEIADTYREMTAGVRRTARLREGADLAAHALRVRFGLGSADPLGRFLARAAPFALAAAAASEGIRLTARYTSIAAAPISGWSWLRSMDGVDALGLLFSLLVCVGAIVALTGRWTVGAAAVVCGLSGTAVLAVCVGWLFGDRVVFPLLALLTVAVVLACPPDLRPGTGASAAAGAMAGVAWLPAIAVDAGVVGRVSTDYGAWPLLVLTGTGIVLALRARSSGLREMAVMAVAAPPFVAHAYVFAWHDVRPVAVMVLALPAAAAFTVAIARVRPPG